MCEHTSTILVLACLCLFTSPALAFGAGEVSDSSHWNGYVWRHGDIEKVLSILPISVISNYAFTKMQVCQVYFGNWLRDYSQLLDVKLLGEVHEAVLRGIVSVLDFMEFEIATDEFDVTKEHLGVYRHEHHIDNPFGYDKRLRENNASLINSRLRGPIIDEELEIDPNTGMKNYIAHSGQGYATAAQYIREQWQQFIRHARNGNQNEAVIHLGTALHTLEDFAAHSNYTELVLRELGEANVFPFVGDKCRSQAPTSGFHQSLLAPMECLISSTAPLGKLTTRSLFSIAVRLTPTCTELPILAILVTYASSRLSIQRIS